jgi:hypothetical protein
MHNQHMIPWEQGKRISGTVFLLRLLIISTPLALGFLEMVHPVIRDARTTYQMLHLQVVWWFILHLLQIALFCLCAMLSFRLIAGRRGTIALLSRVGLLLFLLCSLAYAGVIGIGTGLLVAHADALALAARVCLGQQSSIVEAITTYSGNPLGTGLWVLGSLGWIIGVLTAMLTFSDIGRPMHTILRGE